MTQTNDCVRRAFRQLRRLMWAGCSFALMLLVVTATSAQTTMPVTYEVYAIAYATYPNFAVSNFLPGADPNRKMDA